VLKIVKEKKGNAFDEQDKKNFEKFLATKAKKAR
jgi:hypothetical protein